MARSNLRSLVALAGFGGLVYLLWDGCSLPTSLQGALPNPKCGAGGGLGNPPPPPPPVPNRPATRFEVNAETNVRPTGIVAPDTPISVTIGVNHLGVGGTFTAAVEVWTYSPFFGIGRSFVRAIGQPLSVPDSAEWRSYTVELYPFNLQGYGFGGFDLRLLVRSGEMVLAERWLTKAVQVVGWR